MSVKVKRVYDKASRDDGFRVLVDRVWPRGLRKDAVRIDEWLKDIAPSTELRKWFGHDPDKWSRFRTCYFEELARRKSTVDHLRALARKQPVTLLYGTKDMDHNNAVALEEYLTKGPAKSRRKTS
jgi:uncharacterized protein YeaO (DUF488 family)